MEKQKTRYRLDKKTGHLLEIPSKKQVRENVKKIREQKGKDQLPQSPVTIHETQAEKNFKKVQKVIDRMHAKAKLPDFLSMARHKFLSTVCVINKPGKQRSLLPDKKAASSCSAMARWLRSSQQMYAFSLRFRSPSSRNMKWHQVE